MKTLLPKHVFQTDFSCMHLNYLQSCLYKLVLRVETLRNTIIQELQFISPQFKCERRGRYLKRKRPRISSNICVNTESKLFSKDK